MVFDASSTAKTTTFFKYITLGGVEGKEGKK